MKLPSEAWRLRIYVGENDRFEGRPLSEVVVEEARRKELAGATVVKGAIGFGAHSRVEPVIQLRISKDAPVIIEIVDQPDRIEAFLPMLDTLIGEGLVTLEDVRVITYRHRMPG